MTDRGRTAVRGVAALACAAAIVFGALGCAPSAPKQLPTCDGEVTPDCIDRSGGGSAPLSGDDADAEGSEAEGTTDPGGGSDSADAGADGSGSGAEETPEPDEAAAEPESPKYRRCAHSKVGHAFTCKWKQRFAMGGGTAVITDLTTIAGSRFGASARIAFGKQLVKPVTAVLHTEDPYTGYVVDVAPAKGAKCLRVGKPSCKLEWDLTSAGVSGETSQSIVFTDGSTTATVWVVKISFS